MEYCSLLQEDQWKVKCMSILDRDHCICQDCHKKGIHSTYFPINTINDLEEYFPNALLNGKKLSDYLEDCDWTNNIRTPIRTLSKHIADNIFFSSFETYDIWTHYDFISEREISEINYRKAIDNCLQMNYNDILISGRMFAFSVVESISKSNYAAIKYHCGGNTSLLETLELHIFYNNKLYYLYFSHLNYIDKNPIFTFATLHIHHKYYIKGRNPWEYENDALVTLCADCHQKRHQTTNIPMFSSTKELLKSNLPICDRCQGRGYIPQYYYHCEGICFKCFGEGVCDL